MSAQPETAVLSVAAEGMGRDARIADVRLSSYPVNWRTWWDIVEVETVDGAIGIGEWSDAGPIRSTRPLMQRRATSLLHRSIFDAMSAVDHSVGVAVEGRAPHVSARAWLTMLGGLDAALCDAAARTAQASLWKSAGRVDCYANINRAIRDRTPHEFARAARTAVGAGFETIKCAPFDFLAGTRSLDYGMKLLYAVRSTVGPDVEILIDLHGHLSTSDILAATNAFREIRPGWLEDAAPLNDVEALRTVRDAIGCRLAGGEMVADPEELRPALEAGVLDVVMPDVKHAGGPRKAHQLAATALSAGAQVSLHNPTGPVSTAHSAALTASLPQHDLLELAILETPDRDRLVTPPLALSNKTLAVPHDRIGLGIRVADGPWVPDWTWSAAGHD